MPSVPVYGNEAVRSSASAQAKKKVPTMMVGMLLMALFWIGAIALVVRGLPPVFSTRQPRVELDPEEILRLRYARGEINPEELAQMRDALR